MRAKLSRATVALSVAILVVSTGCGRRIRAVDCPEQIVLKHGRAVLQQAGLAEGVVTPVRVPWQSKTGPVGFRVELTNTAARPIPFELNRVELRDGLDHIHRPICPESLLRAFGVSDEPERPRASRAGYRVYRRHRVRWTTGWGYGSYGYPWWSDRYSDWYDGDPYYEWRRTARFLSELLNSRVLEPNETIVGHILFAYAPEKDDELLLLIPVGVVPPGATSQPVHDGGKAVLTFRFEVR